MMEGVVETLACPVVDVGEAVGEEVVDHRAHADVDVVVQHETFAKVVDTCIQVAQDYTDTTYKDIRSVTSIARKRTYIISIPLYWLTRRHSRRLSSMGRTHAWTWHVCGHWCRWCRRGAWAALRTTVHTGGGSGAIRCLSRIYRRTRWSAGIGTIW